MMAALTRGASLFVLLGFLTAGLAAQSTTTVSGVVTTRADGLPVPGAVVSLVGSTATATTDAEGKYRLDVPPALARAGKIQVKVEGLGLPAKIVDVEIRPDTPATADVGLSLGFEEQITVGSRMAGAEAREGGAGRRHHPGSDRDERLRRDDAGHPGAGAVVQFPAPDHHRRHRHGAPGDAARPRPRSGAGPHQRQAPSSERAGPPQWQHRPRLHRRRPQCHPGLGDRADRDAPRRRRGAVRLGRHRRRHQHRAQRGRVAVRRSRASSVSRPAASSATRAPRPG